MDMITILGLILIGGAGIGYGIYTLMKGKKQESTTGNKGSGKNSDASELSGQIKRKNDKEVAKKDIFNFMEFDKIIDNMILQEKETKYTMVVQCKGINYDLMSEVEQLAVEEGFITFLNTLKFPIQLYVQARAIDLKKSMEIFDSNVTELQTKFNDADDNYRNIANDVNYKYSELESARIEREKYARILDYAQDITRYVERISLNKHVLQRKFYIVLSYYKSEVNSTSEFTKEEIHQICYRELYTRAQSLVGALASCSVTGRVLDSNELAELLYISYNRDDEKLIDVKTALESGFYRLYSTSKDVFEKREEMIQKEVEVEAARRVQEAIQEAIDKGFIKTEAEQVEEFEDRADKEAIALIRDSDVEQEAKETLTEIVAAKHVVSAERRKLARQEELQERENNQRAENSVPVQENQMQTENKEEQVAPKQTVEIVDNQEQKQPIQETPMENNQPEETKKEENFQIPVQNVIQEPLEEKQPEKVVEEVPTIQETPMEEKRSIFDDRLGTDDDDESIV